MSGLALERLGQLMQPEPGNAQEVEGVLNPAATRGPDGQLYLFPRMVAQGNYSRIGIARVLFDGSGEPSGVERMGIALEPEADYELRPDGGGCEDPRVTFVEPFGRYVMTYAAYSARGPRIALAVSKDLLHWERLGLATFESYRGIEFASVADKDASVFPVAVPNHAGKMQMAMIHRPLFPGSMPEQTVHQTGPRLVNLERESMWISYCPMPRAEGEPSRPGLFNSHHRLATPVSPWEKLKIGGGTPPILTRHGWLIIYHGVEQLTEAEQEPKRLRYSAGVMILSAAHPRQIVYRSSHPVLTPSLPAERDGVVANVVFPTGIDRRADRDGHECFDVYYGMADSKIGVARLLLPAELPREGCADSPQGKV
ncbi:MAG: glycosidase [Polyangiaceae bacterium]